MAIDPTATPNTTAEMLRLLGGDLSGSLSSGDKLLALSGLLRSATRSGRRAGLTPQQVIGDIQKSKLAELQARQQVEQLRRDEEQRRQRAAAIQQFTANMTAKQLAEFNALDDDTKIDVIRQARFPEATAMVRNIDEIERRYGPEAAAEYAQYGQNASIVEEPLGDGQIWVGPASQAPSARSWYNRPSAVLARASRAGRMSFEDYEGIKSRLGDRGVTRMNEYLAQNNIQVTRRLSDGTLYYLVNGDWYDNPEGQE